MKVRIQFPLHKISRTCLKHRPSDRFISLPLISAETFLGVKYDHTIISDRRVPRAEFHQESSTQ